MSSSTRKAFGVLIGIDFYPDAANRLRGAVNDVNDTELMISDEYNDIEISKFVAPVTGDPDQATSPAGPAESWPTWENVTTTLEQLTKKASAGDIIYIHYSGHGTLQPTTASSFDYQEQYGTDAALVLLDPHAKERIRYLRGIELALLLDDMVGKGIDLTVTLDSCHSGSISRTEYNAVRSMPWNAAVDAEFPFEALALSTRLDSKEQIYRDAATRNYWLLHPKGYALIAACDTHERAKELHLGKGRYNGALSYHILEALDFCNKNKIEMITYDAIYRRVRAKMYNKIPTQHPILLGSPLVVFLRQGVVARERTSDCEVVRLLNDQQVWLNAGLVRGLCVGDEYEIRPYKAASPLPASRVTITDVQTVNSIARRSAAGSRQENEPQIQVGYYAALVALAKPRAQVRLYREAESAWEQLIEKSIWLQNAPASEPVSFSTPSFSIALTANTQYEILDTSNQQVPYLASIETSSAGAKDRVVFILEHLAKFAFVYTLDNSKGNLLLESEFRIQASAKDDPSNVLKDDCMEVEDGKKITVTFHNDTSKVLHLTVLNLSALRRVKKIYPRHKDYQTILPQNISMILHESFPEDIKPSAQVEFSPRMSIPQRIKDRGAIRATDVLKFIVSTSPISGVSSMELPELWDQVSAGTDAADGAFGSLAQESFVDGRPRLLSSRGEESSVRWACRSIMIDVVLGKI